MLIYLFLANVYVIVVPCTNGKGFNFNTGACEPCPVGTYQLPGLTQVCVSCPAGYSTLETTTVGTADSSCFRKFFRISFF